MSHYNEGPEQSARNLAEDELMLKMAEEGFDVLFLPTPRGDARPGKPRQSYLGCRGCGALVYRPALHKQYCPAKEQPQPANE